MGGNFYYNTCKGEGGSCVYLVVSAMIIIVSTNISYNPKSRINVMVWKASVGYYLQ